MRWRRRRDDDLTEPAEAAEPEAPRDTSAHIVAPASKLKDAKPGQPVEALCGAPVIRSDVVVTDDGTGGTSLCQACFVEQLLADDALADRQVAETRQTSREAGRADGRREHENEIRALAEADARRQREQLEAPRFEVVDDGRAVRFNFENNSIATVRRDHIGSVLLDDHDGVHRVVVDGLVLIAHADRDVVRRHYDQVHDVVFGGRLPAAQAS